MSFKDGTRAGESVSVAMVTVRRPPPAPEPAPPPDPPVAPPPQQAQTATIEQTGADPPPEWDIRLRSCEARLDALRQNYLVLSSRIVECRDWIDVVSSPLYKRVWFVLCGWRWKHLGRWRR